MLSSGWTWKSLTQWSLTLDDLILEAPWLRDKTWVLSSLVHNGWSLV